MRSALRQGANVIRKEAQENVTANQSVDSGDLRKGIKVRTRSRKGEVTATVASTDFKSHWVEFGTEPHGVKKGASRRRGKYQDGKLHPGQSAEPFMRPAADSKTQEAIVAVGEQIRKRLATKHGITTPAGLEVDDE